MSSAMRTVSANNVWYLKSGTVKSAGLFLALACAAVGLITVLSNRLPMELVIFVALLVILAILTGTYSRLDYIVQREIVSKFSEARQQPDYPQTQKPLLRSRLLEEALIALQECGLLAYKNDIKSSQPEDDLDYVDGHSSGLGKPGGNLLHDGHSCILSWNRTANTSLAKHGWAVRVVLRMVVDYYEARRDYDTRFRVRIENLVKERESLGLQREANPSDQDLERRYRLVGDRLKDAEREAGDLSKRGGPDALFAIDRQVDRVPEMKADLTRRLYFGWLVARQAVMGAAIVWGGLMLPRLF